MKIRYCEKIGRFGYCPVAWAIATSTESKKCTDNPQGKNCAYLVDDEPEIEFCPTCGTALGIKEG